MQRKDLKGCKWQQTTRKLTGMGKGGIITLERSANPLGNIQGC
jgi:hypothetical protein